MDKLKELYSRLQSYNAFDLKIIQEESLEDFIKFYEITEEQKDSFFGSPVVRKYLRNEPVDIYTHFAPACERFILNHFNKLSVHFPDITKKVDLNINPSVIELMNKKEINGFEKQVITEELTRVIVAKKFNLLKNFPLGMANSLLEAFIICNWKSDTDLQSIIKIVLQQALYIKKL